ncbi:hypothetical protein QAD02_019243 [Eretmocerus hayati]|uniref:Uncharacterized protein n=1 Tax=Eretmocerus hayati TaxID=131215 RepID=A0ACC2PJ20_9HYME|nr:hypothetical protein QAD02_019243 [Eretmocerus hayati]
MSLNRGIIFIFSILFKLSCINGAVIDFVDEDYFGREADRYDWSRHPCIRDCWHSKEAKTCYYVMVIEQFSAMSKACYDCPYNMTDCSRPHCIPVDGVQKMIYTANRRLPGPAIEVCTNDIIVVDVRNRMLAESTTIHWHGVKQEGTPYMDGVPFVSQCPIHAGETFRYTFKASSSGTYFWHSHTGSQRTDGLYGCLVVHPSFEEDVHRALYDHDTHHMVISDWIHFDANSGLVKEYYDRIGIDPNTLIVNGKGRLERFTRNNKIYYTPTEVFGVNQNQRYRFRLINAGADDCPIRLSIDQHSMLVISLDSRDIRPTLVDAMDIWPGERIDFIVETNQKPDTYWVRLRGFGLCEPSNTSTGAFQVARLWYKSTELRDPTAPIGYNIPRMSNDTRILNPYQKGTESSPFTSISVPLLTSMETNDISLTPKPDQQIYIVFDYNQIDNYDFHRENLYGFNQVSQNRSIGTMQLNHISMKLPPFPLMSQWYMLDDNTLCNSTTIPRGECIRGYCACTHVLQVKLNSVIELVMVDEGRYQIVNHPLHLHGHFFRVVASEKLQGYTTAERVRDLDRQGKIQRRLDRAPIKDTIKAPGGGYTIVRFHANNPGYWFFHCHFEQHANVGMALVFKVGEHKDFPQAPRNFPMCGDYVPMM